ncbi:DUF6596 domain-containing protein [Streptomyces sp. NPDC126510]|uniref:DUF6596 domain-containing protein n=1 Tax=Streptomyces sp. NPDC126510 TaxID=3155317 RepID=UPI0033203087
MRWSDGTGTSTPPRTPVQEALLAAAGQRPEAGVPGNPRGWLIKVASRRLADALRSDRARRQPEERAAALTPRDAFTAPPPGVPGSGRPAVRAQRVVLAGRPHTREIARENSGEGQPGQAEGAGPGLRPPGPLRPAPRPRRGRGRGPGHEQRPPSVLQTLCLIFNEGYTATSGAALQLRDLAGEAVRLTRTVHRLLPGDPEVAGLLALMLLTGAR